MKAASIVIGLIIVALGAWYFLSSGTSGGPASPTGETSTSTDSASMPALPQMVVINYTDEGFSPKSVTVPVGATVSFVNMTSHDMWVASAKHPTHDAYDSTTMSAHCKSGVPTDGSFDQCAAVPVGESWQFTFSKAGTWAYHNHSRATDFGSVVVTAPILDVSGEAGVSI